MSAYNIELPALVLAGLYKKAIVQGEGKAVSESVRPAPTGAGLPAEPVAPLAPVSTAPVAQPVAGTPAAQAAPAQPIASSAPPVATPATPTAPAGQQPAPAGQVYKTLGNNRQQVTLVVHCPGEAFLPEHHLQMLTKMLGACKLNLGDVAIVNDANQPVDIQTLQDQLHPKRVLLFGLTPESIGLPLSFPPFKDQEYAGTTYLHTPSLDELNVDTEDGKLLKRRLWDGLRKIFGI